MFALTVMLSASDKLPYEAANLVAKRERAIEKIDEKFVTELEKLKKTFTKRGDLESANAIVFLIASVKDGRNTGSKKETIEGVWKRGHDGMVWYFDDKGGGKVGRTSFTVAYDKSKGHFILKASDWTNILTYSSDSSILNGDTLDGGTYQLKKTE